ncbi:hypothetical protein MMC26_002075 [Xylographa opegraphella]|nr:hypothetical protein [Xylographa opegraphella]
MFTSQSVRGQLPTFDTKRALVVLNLQNSSFDSWDDFAVCEPRNFVENIKRVIPVFRRAGEIVWVRTEFDDGESAATSPVSTNGSIGTSVEGSKAQPNAAPSPDYDRAMVRGIMTRATYHPTRRAKAVMRHASAKTRSEQRDEQLDIFVNDDDDDADAYLSKPRKGQPPRLFAPGTPGVALTDDILPFVDMGQDMIIVKNHYSAFDATPLLLSLRMKLVTHIYLCGLLSNVSIYATAADAVRHGFEVTVVEDCMGYRSEAKHLDAMRQMADILGVSGIDTEEIISEFGGREPPDTEMPIFLGPGMDGIKPPSLVTEGYDLGRSPPDLHDANRRTIKQYRPPADRGINSASIAQSIETAEQQCVSSRERPSPHESPVQASKLPASREEQAVLSPTLTPITGVSFGECDSTIIADALSARLSREAFALLKTEVEWQAMNHRGGEVPRKVAVQGEVGKDGSKPIYRHPADESPPLLPFSPTVQRIREEVQRILKQPLNHALIQLYRDGQDNISEHSDKTLDIVRDSGIVSVSLGAQRTMVLRTKRDQHLKNGGAASGGRQIQRIPLPHNSIFVLGPRTNRRWLHAIRPDKRDAREKSEEEKASDGERISITFRNIGTFTDKYNRKIWGQGAVSKYSITAGTVSTNNSTEMDAMIEAFGKENHQSDFNWEAEYGEGFNAVNLVSDVAQVYLCQDRIANLRVLLSVLDRDIRCEVSRTMLPEGRRGASDIELLKKERPTFRDNDEGSSEVVGCLAILFYLDKFYPVTPSVSVTSRQLHRLNTQVFSRVTQANEILFLWQELQGSLLTASTQGSHSLRRRHSNTPGKREKSAVAEFEGELEIWEEYAEETDYVGGDLYAIVDCAFWPVLHDIVQHWDGWSEQKFPDLAAYYRKVLGMKSVQQALAKIA